jgi:hypothetical protein
VAALLAAAVVLPTEGRSGVNADAVFMTNDTTGLAVGMGPERVVALSPTNVVNQWGPWQFPSIDRLADGRLHVWFNTGRDSAVDYGVEAHYVSSDTGLTWRETGQVHGGLRLPNGDRVEKAVMPSLKPVPAGLPKPVGRAADYGVTYDLYATESLDRSLRACYLYRLKAGRAEWTREAVDVVGTPDLPRYVTEGVFPIPWFDNLRLGPDKALYAERYGHREGTRERTYGALTSRWRQTIVIYRSADAGRTWSVQGEIPYAGDPAADPQWDKRAGFTEGGFEFMPDGTMVCFMRTQDGNGSGPMYVARSADRGRTWSTPARFYAYGVWPQALRLENGVVVLSFGRPGVMLLFNADGSGRRWEHPLPLPEVAGTCSYTGLAATRRNGFAIVYSRWPVKNADGQDCKAIAVREFTVDRRRPGG